MARFLHEFEEWGGERHDNGWWEIEGEYLYNRAGGRHRYTPKEDDEIREGEWEDIIREAVIRNDETTGWIAPEGRFYGCWPRDHRDVARYVFGCEEIELEEKGFCKIYETPLQVRISSGDLFKDRYGYYPRGRRLTAEQKRTLQEKGFEVEDF